MAVALAVGHEVVPVLLAVVEQDARCAKLGQVADGLTPIDLMAQGIARAAEDAGIRARDIDGLLCATTQSRTAGLNLSEYLGISPRFIDTSERSSSRYKMFDMYWVRKQ